MEAAGCCAGAPNREGFGAVEGAPNENVGGAAAWRREGKEEVKGETNVSLYVREFDMNHEYARMRGCILT